MSKPDEEILPSFDFPGSEPAAEAVAAPPEVKPVVQARCPCCGAVRPKGDTFCGDCGYFFKEPYPSDEELAAGAPVAVAAPASADPIRVRGRYELVEQLAERQGVERFRARDLGVSGTDNLPV